MSIKVGLIGAGKRQRTFYVPVIKKLEKIFSFSGVTNRTKEKGERLASDLGCKFYNNPKDLVEKEKPDFLIVCVKHSATYDVLETLEGLDVPLLIETPVEDRRIVEFSERYASEISVAEQWPYLPIEQFKNEMYLNQIIDRPMLVMNDGRSFDYHAIAQLRTYIGRNHIPVIATGQIATMNRMIDFIDNDGKESVMQDSWELGNVTFNKSDNSLNFADNVKAKFGSNQDAEIFHDASTGINDLRIIDKVGHLKLETASNKDVILRTGVTTQTNLRAVATQGVELYFAGNKKFETTNSGAVVTGILTATETSISEKITVGTGGTALTSTNTGRVGVGTAIPSSDVTIKKESATTVEVVAETGVPKVSIGLTGETKNKGILRFGSESNTLDIINNDTGDLNFIIDGDSNSGSGNFKFVDNVTERARLTNDGKLGIAITNPSHQLHVVGTSTVTSNAFIGGNLSVGGTITGTLALGNLIEGTNLLTTSGISTFNQVNFTNSVGFGSAIPKVDVDFQTAVASFSGVGIGTTNPGNRLKVVGTSFFDTIGVNTTAVKIDTLHNPGGLQLVAERLYLYDSQLRLDLSRQSKIGFGTAGDTLSGSIDLRKAGDAISPWAFLPEMTTSVRNSKTTAVGQNASGIGTGAVIYNTTTNRVEIYLPSDGNQRTTYWCGISTVG